MVGLFLAYHQSKHGVGRGDQVKLPPPPPLMGGPDLSFLLPKNYDTTTLPVGGMSGLGDKPDQPLGSLCTSPRAGTLVILEEGNQTYPRCPKCDMFVSKWALNDQHHSTYLCRQGKEWKLHRLEEEEARSG